MKNILFKKNIRGFTIIEMLVTIGVLTLLTSMVLVYSRQSESTSNLIREADRLVFEINQTKNLSMLTLKQSNGEQQICGWGIHFEGDNSKSYKIFRDFCGSGTQESNYAFDPGEEYESVVLLRGVVITQSNISDIVFKPPEPRVKLNPPSGGDAIVKICLEQKSDVCFTINVNSAGRVYRNIETTSVTETPTSSSKPPPSSIESPPSSTQPHPSCESQGCSCVKIGTYCLSPQQYSCLTTGYYCCCGGQGGSTSEF